MLQLCCGCVLSHVIPWTVICQALLAMGFSRQEYWSGLPFPSPENLPRDRTYISYTAGRFFTTSPTGEALILRI